MTRGVGASDETAHGVIGEHLGPAYGVDDLRDELADVASQRHRRTAWPVLRYDLTPGVVVEPQRAAGWLHEAAQLPGVGVRQLSGVARGVDDVGDVAWVLCVAVSDSGLGRSDCRADGREVPARVAGVGTDASRGVGLRGQPVGPVVGAAVLPAAGERDLHGVTGGVVGVARDGAEGIGSGRDPERDRVGRVGGGRGARGPVPDSPRGQGQVTEGLVHDPPVGVGDVGGCAGRRAGVREGGRPAVGRLLGDGVAEPGGAAVRCRDRREVTGWGVREGRGRAGRRRQRRDASVGVSRDPRHGTGGVRDRRQVAGCVPDPGALAIQVRH